MAHKTRTAMAMDEKLVTLVQRLRARGGGIGWERTDEEGTFETDFNGFAVQISESEGEEPLYTLRIFDREGAMLDEFTDEDLTEIMNRSEPTEPNVMFTVMQDIYRAARRSALGVDKAVDAILAALGD
jgi:hypothetical protein